MTYNEAHFSHQDNLNYKNRLFFLQEIQDFILDYLKKYLVETNNIQQLKNCENFIYLLIKIRFNLESIINITNNLFEDYRFKTSINILYRTLISDLINVSYLMAFVDLSDEKQQSLDNELTILHREFCESATEWAESEYEFYYLRSKRNNSSISEKEDVRKFFKDNNPELLNEFGDWKSNKEIRDTTNIEFRKFMKINDNKRNGFISENEKINFIKSREFPNYPRLKFLFKYYSQFQHFTPKTNDLLLNNIDYEISTYYNSLEELVLTLYNLRNTIKFNNIEIIIKEWHDLEMFIANNHSKINPLRQDL